jgi:hypothetical protein
VVQRGEKLPLNDNISRVRTRATPTKTWGAHPGLRGWSLGAVDTNLGEAKRLVSVYGDPAVSHIQTTEERRMAMDNKLNLIDNLEIEPLSDEALETVAGGKSSDGPACCSCSSCSNGPKLPPQDPPPDEPIIVA